MDTEGARGDFVSRAENNGCRQGIRPIEFDRNARQDVEEVVGEGVVAIQVEADLPGQGVGSESGGAVGVGDGNPCFTPSYLRIHREDEDISGYLFAADKQAGEARVGGFSGLIPEGRRELSQRGRSIRGERDSGALIERIVSLDADQAVVEFGFE